MTVLRHGLFAAASLLFSAAHSVAADEPCKSQEFGGARYIVCSVEAKNPKLKLFWQKPDGTPFRWFGTLASSLKNAEGSLVFAMNAGMYGTDYAPMGLYIEAGKELRPADLKKMSGPQSKIPNFYKQPNGIFYFGASGTGILTTERFLKERPQADFATQSGPMLVVADKMNPIFIEGSSDRTRRSGVGVCDGGVMRFAISEDDVNFFDFAKLFQTHLDCPDALFLDGGQGAGFFNPALKRADWSWHGGYGPMIGFVE